MVLDVAGLDISVDEREVERAGVPLVGEQRVQVLQRGALAELHLARDAGALDEGPADVVVLAAHVDGDDLAVVGES